MPEFLHLSTPLEALQTLVSALPDRDPATETIETVNSLGRILAEPLLAPHPLPEFPRSTVDGYAVRARDTFGVSESLPGYLEWIGEIVMGSQATITIKPGTCASIHTGGMLPDGADAVLMLEYTQPVRRLGTMNDSFHEIEFSRSVAVGENIIRLGEDVAENQLVISRGRRIRPAEIGGCMALGITAIRVAVKPRIGILSTGDEVVPPHLRPHLGQVRDVNSYSLAALVAQAGGEPVLYGIIPDNLQVLKENAARALRECDAVLITAGSSASARDMTADAIDSLGKPGVLVHGVNIRPGKPTILAVCDGKAMIGLPGNPVSALVIGGLFVTPLIEKLSGKNPEPRDTILAKLQTNLPSQAGREDWVPVKLVPPSQDGKDWLADPVFGKSNLIFSLSIADGLVRIPADATGIAAGDTVEVTPLR